MTRLRYARQTAAALLLVATAGTVHAADKQTGLRPQVGKPLQAAQGLIEQRKYQEALAQIRRAEIAAPLSAEEISLLEELRGIAAQGIGDTATAAHAFEAAIASGKLTPADQLRLMQMLASLYYQVKDYPKAITWAERYQDAGGNDEATRTLLAQSYYLNQDWAGANRILTAQIAAADQAGGTAQESQLRLLADIELKQNDTAGYQACLEKLVSAYPKAEYWTALIERLAAQPGFPRRLALDVSRLSLAVGTLSSAQQYTQTAELALEAGLPGEAKSLLDQGFAAHRLGVGPEAGREERLRALAAQQAEEDLNGLAQRTAAAVSAPDGLALTNVGVDYLGYGQPEKAAQLIEQGLARGVKKHSDDARLHLGLAYLAAGQRAQSLQAFRSIQDRDAAKLAWLWAIYSAVHAS